MHSFTAEGIGLMYSQAHVTAKVDGLTISIATSSIALCKSMAYVIGVTEKEVPGSIGAPRHVMGSLIMDGSWKSSRPRLRSSEQSFERPKRVSDFSQIKLDPVTRQTQFTFQGCTNANYESTGAVMGHCSSMQLGNILMNLMFCDILSDHSRLSYADNMNIKAPSIGQLLNLYEKILKRSRLFNLTWKLSDTHIAMSTSRPDEEFECLGFSIGKNGIQIPKRRKDQYIDGIPRTRKEIIRLIGRVNFFSLFSPSFSEVLKDIRSELTLMKARKFTMTPRLEAALKACIALYVNSPGVWFLSEADYATKPFILFCDASHDQRGIGSL